MKRKPATVKHSTAKKVIASTKYGKFSDTQPAPVPERKPEFSTRFAQAIQHTHELALTLATMSEEEIKFFSVLGILNKTFAESKVPYALLRTYRKEERAAWGPSGAVKP